MTAPGNRARPVPPRYSVKLIDQFKDRLPSHQYLALRRFAAGFPYEGIGVDLGIPRGTVRSRIHRARAKMATLLAAERHPNGAAKWAIDGTLLDERGNRSIFDDVDE